MDIHSENQKTCRGDDYLRIKGPGGKQKFYCGQADSQLDEEVTFQQMGPWGQDKKIYFSFRSNNDEENGGGVQLVMFADDMGILEEK